MTNSTEQTPEERLNRLLVDTPITDTHNDFPYVVRIQLHNEIQGPDFDFHKLNTHTDINKLKKGRLGLQFFSCYIEVKSNDPYYQDFNLTSTVVRDTLEQIDVTKRLMQEYSEDFEFVNSSKEALSAYRTNKKIAVTLGVEGMHQVDTSLAVIRQYYDLGVRYITLTHNCDNPFATAASSVTGGLPDKGLSEYGVRGVLEMNRIGMMVDLSHVSYKTMLDVLDVTKAPVIFSHSSAYALTPHERNVRDDVLLRVKENRGVVQVNFFPAFITQTKEEDANGRSIATIDDAVDHIFHVASVAGWECVGFGSDFDGIQYVPEGLEDVTKYPDLIYKCMARGATDEQIQGLIGGNLLRVWNANEEVSKQMKLAKTPVVEKEWDGRKWTFSSYSKGLGNLYPGADQTETYKSNEWVAETGNPFGLKK
ncbi:unnamed protein product [Kuraishia capsulata CBS 1993]|uniref:Dipeptidase n=1 Tax=Kuraishia capsulata CBS 1993 TaxID=1382522 RepID=W6MHF6_9ASCO|nr:uncharacterized protein KUCA_T00001070001 [Kuraishia capsulata CBS 1993]CDK25103.1 unnamed protein product [Kuraishia capsulata CBS 1993]